MLCARDALRQRWPCMWPDWYTLGNSGLEVKWRIGTREKDMCVISMERSLNSRHRWGPCGCSLGNTPSRGIGKGIGTNWSKGKRLKEKKILKEMGIPDHLTCPLRNLYAGQEAIVELDMEQQTGSKLGKEYIKAVYCHPAYPTSVQSTSCEMPAWMKHKLESRFPGKISITSGMQITLPLWEIANKN